MRVVHLSCVAPPQTGGMGRVPATDVALLRARGIEAIQAAPASANLSSSSSVIRIPTAWSFGNAARLKPGALEKVLANADIVHLHYPFYGTAGQIAKLRQQGVIKRLVMTLHMDATAEGPKEVFFRMHRMLFQKKILSSADRLLASSLDYVRASSYASFADRVTELAFGINTTVFVPGASTRERFGMDPTAFTLGFVGGMDSAHAFKGIDILFHAIARVPNVCVALVGDGDLRPSYEALASYLGIRGRVTFLGKIDDASVISFYRSIDALALPSVSGAEAFGLVALESQACGTPVIASDLPGVRTVVLHKQTGILVPPGSIEGLEQGIRRMMDQETRKRLASATRVHVESRYTLETYADQLIQIYRDLCALPS